MTTTETTKDLDGAEDWDWGTEDWD